MPDTEHFRDVLAQFDVWSAVDIVLIALLIFAVFVALALLGIGAVRKP